MKRLRALILLFSFPVLLIAQSDQDLFNQATSNCTKHDYATALKDYTAISKKSAATWYNSGVAAFLADDAQHAMLYWLRARKNGSFAMQQLVDERLNNFFPTMVVERNVFSDIVDQAMIILQLFLILISWLCAYFFYRNLMKKKSRWQQIFLLCGLFFIIGCLKILHQQEKDYALVMHESSLYAGPSSSYPIVQQITPGKIVMLIASHNDWKQIEVEKERGWIARSDLEIINEG